MDKTAYLTYNKRNYSCFGHVDGKLYLGSRHHMALMQHLLTNEGYTWDDLVNAKQNWGWIRTNPDNAWNDKSRRLRFSTDAAELNPKMNAETQAAFHNLAPDIDWIPSVQLEQTNTEYGPTYHSEYGEEAEYAKTPIPSVLKYDPHTNEKTFYDLDSVNKTASLTTPGGLDTSCFGYIDGVLYMGTRHHMALMNYLLEHGYDWEKLANARQTWGWYWEKTAGDWDHYNNVEYTGPTVGSVRFSTDAGLLDPKLENEAVKAMEECFKIPFEISEEDAGQTNSEFAPVFRSVYGPGGYYEGDQISVEKYVPSWTKEKEKAPQAPVDQQQLFDPNTLVPGGGNPPPKKAYSDSDDYDYDHEYDDHYNSRWLWHKPSGSLWMWGVNPRDFEDNTHYDNIYKLENQGLIDSRKYQDLLTGYIYGGGSYDAPKAIHDSLTRYYQEYGDLPYDNESRQKKVLVKVPDDDVSRTAGFYGTRKFVYDRHTNRLEVGDDYGVHHLDILARWGIPEEHLLRHLHDSYLGNNPNTRFIFGYHDGEDAPHLYGNLPEGARADALGAYQSWSDDEATDQGSDRYAALDEQAIHENQRAVWLIDYKHNLRGSEIGSGAHHIDLGWSGDEPAAGDVYIQNGEAILRILEHDPTWDLDSIVGRVVQWWDKIHPEAEISHIVDARPEDQEWESHESHLTKGASYDILSTVSNFSDPKIIDGWTVYEMESGEYPHHEAILIDRSTNRMFINYNGHHAPMIEGIMNAGLPMPDGYNEENPNGHYRLAPSDHEPFSEGWGWHGPEADDEEKAVLKQVLKAKYQVNKLQDAWVINREASAPEVEWLQFPGIKPTSKTIWKGLWDSQTNKLYMWNIAANDQTFHWNVMSKIDPEATSQEQTIGRFVALSGDYHTIGYISAVGFNDPDNIKRKVKAITENALEQKWPTAMKETHFKAKPQRFMITTDGQLLLGDYQNHYDLINDYLGKTAAERYLAGPVVSEDYPLISGGFLEDNGTIVIIHTPGEADFDITKLAIDAYKGAKDLGEFVNGDVIYKDWRLPDRPETRFDVFG